MAESDKANSLSEDYLLKDVEEKLKVADSEPEEKTAEEVTPPVTPPPVESAVTESAPEETENVSGPPPPADEDVTQPPPTPTEEETTENAAEEEVNTENETPEIKLETAPGDYRFPTTNQSRHCFTRYVEYHRCVAAKGEEDASECDKFAKYYRSLCPGEWIDRWNEQRENGTFPGPL